MQKLIVSMMRFSTAMTLFGMEQMQSGFDTVTGNEDLSKSMDNFRKSVDSITESLISNMDKDKKSTVDSFSRASEKTVNRSFDMVPVAMMDPREWMRVTNDIVQRSSETMQDWMEKQADEEAEKPKSAASALSKSKKKKRKSKSASKAKATQAQAS